MSPPSSPRIAHRSRAYDGRPMIDTRPSHQQDTLDEHHKKVEDLLQQMAASLHLVEKLQQASKQLQWTSLFRDFDKNGDGRISKKEWQHVLQEKLKLVQAHESAQADLIFDLFDDDASGYLDITEFHRKAGETHRAQTRQALVSEFASRARSLMSCMAAQMEQQRMGRSMEAPSSRDAANEAGREVQRLRHR